ncbi:hypothetical protein FDP22_06685 [Paroceanicella profunda]|uniref:Uncharacterized protein n=1 Tax=Paroceanicella profunda TaxID=2579971 RepID=A0A5B8FT00_9RHOB|nr:hypothetical protein [Paroceanicella profunda]QDL91495.1 hypothetical protein FDP22_06685 [Paroceanicella profunda]
MFEPVFAIDHAPGLLAALDRPFHHVIQLAHLDWPDGEVLLWSGLGPLTLGGRTFHGSGALGEIEHPEDSDAGAVQTVTARLRGMPLSFLAAQGREDLTGRRAALGWTLLGDDGLPIPAPVFSFNGYLDGRKIGVTRSADGLTVEVAVTLTTGERPASRISQRHVPQDATAADTGWGKLTDMSKDPQQWPGVAE